MADNGNKLDFRAVADSALARIDTVLSHWLPGGKRQGAEYVALNPTRADNSARSFSINLNTGVWSDFASGDSGGDLIALVAYLENASQGDACKRLASFLGFADTRPGNGIPATTTAHRTKATAPTQPPQWQAILPVPDSALASCPDRHPKLGKPSMVWGYKDAQGRLLLKVLRFNTGTGKGRRKEFRPLTFGQDASGKQQWTWKQPPDKRPLYGLEHLAADDSAPVLLVEGEKAADAGRQLFPDMVVMTWPGGSKAIGKADFSPLAGRAICYWPDHDSAGRESVPVLFRALQSASGGSLSLLNCGHFAQYAPGYDGDRPALVPAPASGNAWPEKADAADALALGWTADHMALLRDQGLFQPYQANSGATATPGADSNVQRESRYKSTDAGLFFFDVKTETYRPIGGRLDVLARSRNQDGRSWGLLVSFDDFDGHHKEWNIGAALFSTEGGAEVVRGLLDRGYALLTNREAKKRLLEYLGDYNTPHRVRLVERMGWHGGTAFMLPDRVIGTPREPLHYYSDAPPLCKMAQAGTLAQWRDNVAAYCEGNNLLTFAVSAALAAPLLDVLGSETCGFHFVGDSSLGKSTLLKVAASVYGHPGQYPRTWRATDNALEATAAAHSDCLLVLDEIGQIEPRIVGETVYMLGNGEGKTRATETGASRGTQHRWRLVFLSSGEKTLIDHMAEANKKPQAGMEMRLLTLPACPHDNSPDRVRLGIYDIDHGTGGGADLSARLIDQAGQYHGTAAVAFVEKLLEKDRESLAAFVVKRQAEIKKTLVDKDSSGQVHRAADKFALVAVAGEFAALAGITGWQYGWATRAAERCFRLWLAFRGGAGNLEDQQALDHVRTMLTRYGESRFTRWESDDARIDEHAPRTMERWGFRKTVEETDSMLGNTTENLFILPRDGFKDLCQGLDYKRVARVLNESGALVTDKEPGRLTKKTRLPGGGKGSVNCYVIRFSALLSESEDGPPSPPDQYQEVA